MLDIEVPRLKNIFKEDLVTVSVVSPPKYLQPFMKDPKIIFVYKEPEETDKLDQFRPKMNKSCDSSYSDDLDLTGNPLEAPFSSDDDSTRLLEVISSKEEYKHYPVNITDVRRAISTFNLKMQLDIPFVALTNESHSDTTAVLGSAKNDGWYSRFWINIQDFTAHGSKVIDVDNMIDEHNKLSFSNRQNTDSEVSCRYVMESIGDTHATFLHELNGSVEFNLTWKTPSFHVPVDQTDVIITIKSSIGHDNSEIASLWNQLTLLHDYLIVIKKWEQDRNSEGLYSRRKTEYPNIKSLMLDETNPKSVENRLSHLLREPNEIHGSITSKLTANDKKTLEETVRKVNSEKTEEEFTDRLWDILIECSSFEELSNCISRVFQALRNGTCKPYVTSTNITRLAYAIRCCKKDRNMFSAAFEPLELLIEIGIEKLKKEFLSIYLLARIATAEQLFIPELAKFPEITPAQWTDISSQWIVWLLRLHVSLQLMLLTENMIKFKGCMQPLTASTLKHFCGVDSPIQNVTDPRTITSESFTTAMDSANINDLVNRKTPFNSWRLKLHSETENRRVTSIYYRDMNDMFPASVNLTDILENSGNNTYVTISNDFPYHCYNFHSVSDYIE